MNKRCVIPCDPGYYGTVDGECLECVDPCSECSGDADKCTDCIFGYKLYDNNECRKKCVYPCATCTEPTTCISKNKNQTFYILFKYKIKIYSLY